MWRAEKQGSWDIRQPIYIYIYIYKILRLASRRLLILAHMAAPLEHAPKWGQQPVVTRKTTKFNE